MFALHAYLLQLGWNVLDQLILFANAEMLLIRLPIKYTIVFSSWY